MRAPQIEIFTAADYREMPDDGRRYQLIEGELITSPAPNMFHQFGQRNLLRIIDSYLLQNPIGTVVGAPCDVYLDDHNVFQPDLAYMAVAHATRLQADGIHGAPDLIVEILSPSTAAVDRRKRAHFAAAGTVEFWQIDPALRQIRRFVFAENTTKPIALIDEPETFVSPLFPGLTLATADIFRR